MNIFELTQIDHVQLTRLGELGSELFVETFGHLYQPHDLQAFLERVFSVEGLAADLQAGRRIWIAETEGEWIGYCKMGPCGLPVDTQGRRALELKQLYVSRPYHGQGVADRLMNCFMDWAQREQAEDLFISCWSENQRALRFYRRHGFDEVGAYTFWVGNHGDDERILKRSLS